MNDFTNSDKRVPLRQGQEITANNKTYVVCSVVNRGGSAITYDINVEGNKSLHYILKEFYPKQLEDYIVRKLDGSLEFKFDEAFTVEHLKELKVRFLKEFEFQSENLPANNSPRGAYFFHGAEQFESNNTAYIIVNTGNYLALKDTLEQNKDWDLCDILKIFCDICDALDALHTNICGDNDMRILHLDISDRNILISNDDKHLVKIIDFGSSKKISDIEKQNFTISSYTPEFAPIEVKAAFQKAYFKHIGVQSDLYSVCAILFKYTVGEKFEPAIDRECEKKWVNILKKKYKKNFGMGNVKNLIAILRKGLSGYENRYKSAAHLKEELETFGKFLTNWQRSKKKFRYINGTLVSVILLFLSALSIAYFSHATPRIELISNTYSQYFESDTICLSYKLTDENGLNDKHLRSINNNIKTVGFDADISLDSAPTMNGNEIMYNIVFSNLVFDGDGEKSIEIGQIYKTERFSKSNSPHTFTFYGFVEEPSITISKPNFTRVNAGENYSIYYDITFNVPENEEYDFNLSTVGVNGFSSEKTRSEHLSDNVYRLIFEGIQGKPGEASITILEGACKLKNGAVSRAVSASAFEIVEESVLNYPIQVDLSVVSQKFEDNGFVVLSHHASNEHNYISLMDKTYIHCIGFEADITVTDTYIILNNIIVDKTALEPKLLIDSGVYISKDNGSVSDAREVTFPTHEYNDIISPVIGITTISKKEVYPGDNVICLINGTDDSKLAIINKIHDIIIFVGFTANTVIDIQNNNILLTFNNIRPTKNDEPPKIILVDGIYRDISGNLSSSCEFLPFKFVS